MLLQQEVQLAGQLMQLLLVGLGQRVSSVPNPCLDFTSIWTGQLDLILAVFHSTNIVHFLYDLDPIRRSHTFRSRFLQVGFIQVATVKTIADGLSVAYLNLRELP